MIRERQKAYGDTLNGIAGAGSAGYLPLQSQTRRPVSLGSLRLVVQLIIFDQLGEIQDHNNVPPPPTFSTSYTSPIFANDPNGVWGPPTPQPPEMTIHEVSNFSRYLCSLFPLVMSADTLQKLAQAEKKIRELSVENSKLRQHVYAYAVSSHFVYTP
jgi:hypothetical protein